MFKPVTGVHLNEFDDETRALYAKRQSDPRLTHALLNLPRTSRNHVPIIASQDHPTVVDNKAYISTFFYKVLAAAGFMTFACHQFTKAYFPYGIILRRSIP